MPSWEQLRRGEEAVRRFRERVGPKVDVLWVLPDLYEELPKPCMGGWGRTAMVVTPNGDVLPCQAASTIPGTRIRQRPRASARLDLERVRRVRAVPRNGLDAGAVPLVPARAPGSGLGRLPLPGAAAHRRRRGHRSGLPALAASRSRRGRARVGADRRVRLSHDETPSAPKAPPSGAADHLHLRARRRIMWRFGGVWTRLTPPPRPHVPPVRSWRGGSVSHAQPLANSTT